MNINNLIKSQSNNLLLFSNPWSVNLKMNAGNLLNRNEFKAYILIYFQVMTTTGIPD